MDDGVYPFYTTLDGKGGPQLLEADSDANLYAVRKRNNDVTFHVIEGDVPGTADAPGTTNAANAKDHVTYEAASTQNITFRFRATGTSIKGGEVLFRIPVPLVGLRLPSRTRLIPQITLDG